jgi:hypothetical protein
MTAKYSLKHMVVVVVGREEGGRSRRLSLVKTSH